MLSESLGSFLWEISVIKKHKDENIHHSKRLIKNMSLESGWRTDDLRWKATGERWFGQC